jgi:hypothetical protein
VTRTMFRCHSICSALRRCSRCVWRQSTTEASCLAVRDQIVNVVSKSPSSGRRARPIARSDSGSVSHANVFTHSCGARTPRA